MMRSVRLLSIATWALAAGCSDARQDAPDGGPRRAEPSAGSSSSSTDGAGASAAAQGFDRGTVPMKVSAKIGRKSYEADGLGECASSSDASIYEVPATLYTAAYEGQGEAEPSLNLTIWRLKASGEEQVNLSIRTGETAHQIATVKGGELVGSGTAGVIPAGKGGTLTVEGKDGDGEAVVLKVVCERFDEVVAEGG